jgi:hypothetical protein
LERRRPATTLFPQHLQDLGGARGNYYSPFGAAALARKSGQNRKCGKDASRAACLHPDAEQLLGHPPRHFAQFANDFSAVFQ